MDNHFNISRPSSTKEVLEAISADMRRYKSKNVCSEQKSGMINTMRKKYETDLTDEQWQVIKPLFVNMRKYNREKRELVDSLLYLSENTLSVAQFTARF